MSWLFSSVQLPCVYLKSIVSFRESNLKRTICNLQRLLFSHISNRLRCHHSHRLLGQLFLSEKITFSVNKLISSCSINVIILGVVRSEKTRPSIELAFQLLISICLAVLEIFSAISTCQRLKFMTTIIPSGQISVA